MLKRLLIASLSTASIPHIAVADFYDGNELHNHCTGENSYSHGVCQGYIVGIWDNSDVDKRCPVPGARLGQIVDVAKAYLRNHPEDRHFAAESLVNYAFETAFCK